MPHMYSGHPKSHLDLHPLLCKTWTVGIAFPVYLVIGFTVFMAFQNNNLIVFINISAETDSKFYYSNSCDQND